MKKSMTAKLISVAAALACIFAAGEAQANGIEPTVVAGQASFSTAGSSLSITNSPGAIINWQGFSISAGETTRFTQQSAASSVLNRVIGSDPSVILGSLTSNGRVFLINPGGILFGQGARIDVAGLVASTLNLSNQDFLAGRLNFTANPLAGNMENQGSITTPSGGSVYLLGANVSNSGIINSPQGDVILAAGQSVNIFDSSTPGVRVELTASDNAGVNLGEILAQSGQVGIYGAALRNSGLINADQVSRDASGKIVLRAKQDITLEAGSRLSANGEQAGAITVQSDAGTTLVSGTIEAKGTGAVAGNGGTIKLLGDMQSGTVNVGGTLDASASMDGNGGFIETSAAHVKVTDDAIVTTQSAQGKSGTWLIDPIDFTVATGSGGLTASGIGASTLSASLGTGNVSIATNATTTGNGDIFVNDVVSWTANTLTLTAHRNININAAMTASTGASLALNPGTGMVVTGRNSIGNFIGRVDFSGTGTLAIGGTTYTVINSLGNENSTTGLDLQGMNGNLAGNYALGADIDATATGTTWATVGFVPIGTFTGTFDGLGHTINSLRINSGAASAGLFGATGTTSTFNNVGLVGGSVTGAAGSGGLIGTNGAGSTVNNSYNTGNVSGSAGTGGLVGDNTTGAISNSYSTGTVTGASGTGGLIGTNTTGAISNSYSTGTVTGSNAGTGGLVGSNTTGTVSKSYATGSVTGTGASTGGLLGSNGANTVSDSYATGNVSGGGSSVGGLIGSNDGAVTTSYSTGSVSGAGTNKGALVGLIGTGTVTTSFWNSDTSITQLGGGRGMTTAEMQTQANFTSATTANGSVNPAWGFPGTWVMYDGYTYPLLQSFMTPLTVTANNFTKTYNGVAYSGGNGVTPTPGGNLLGTVSYSGTSQGAINVSNYVITPSGLYSNQQGYIISYADGSLTIDPYVVNLTGTRAYDGTLNVAAGVLTIGTLIGTETLNLAGTGTVASKNVGTAKTVTLGTLALSDGLNGGLASNYTFTGGTQTTNVTQAPLTLSASNVTKTYDGSLTAVSTAAVTGGSLFTGDTLSGGSFAFTDKNVGSGNKTVTAAAVTVNDTNGGGNYAVSYANNITSTIDPYVVNLTGTRAYDGTLNVAAGVLTIGTLIGTETLNLAGTGTVASKNVGTAKTVTLGTLALSDGLNGGLASNYTFTGGTQTTNVTQAPLTLSASNVTKTYDGSLTAVSTAAVTGGSLFTGDTLSGGSFAFTDKNVGSGNKTVTAAAVTVNDTNGGGNYAVSYANNITSTIDPYVVNLTGTKVYDTNTTFGFATFGTAGTISTGLGTETLLLSGTGTVVSKNVAAGSQTVTLGSLALNDVGGTGGLASNYTFTGGTQTATVTVAPVSFTGTKVYDTNTNFGFATFGTAGTISALGTETLLLSGTGTVASKNVSAGSQTVTTAGLVLNDVVGTGGLASNYTFTGGTQTAAVTVAPVSFTGTKVYDTNTNFGFATFGTAGTISALGGETLLLSGTGTVADKNVSAGSQTVTTTGLALNDVVGTGGLASNYTFTSGTQTANITALGITGSITAANKVYDATDVATISGRSLTGVLGTDTVSYSGGAASFANKNVGNGKTVTGTGLVLAGADAGNYTVNSSATTTADITALGITGNITADNKVYDQTNTATILTRSLTGVLGTDVVSYSGGTATFSDKNVASGKTVSGSGLSLAGADAGNYTVNASATTTADITALGITGSITAGNKVYDATDLATITGRSLVGAIAGDVVSYSGGAASFSDKNAGTGKTVSGTGLTLTGADAGNYTVNTSATTTADITKAALTVSSIGQNKVYDATPSATVTLVDNRLGSDVLALGYGAASFNDKIIGAAKTVAVTGIALGGADAGNYSFNTTTSTTADIMALAITGSITAANKAYDASDAATITGRSVAGVLGADVVSYSGGTASFDNKNAGTGKTVTGTGLGLTGADAGNYTVNSTATTQADITPAPLDITANSATRVYGDANPTFAATYTGFQTGESAATLSGTLAFASPSVPSSNVGNYAIIPSGQSSTNYTISYINGTLSVAPVSLMVTADAKSKVYGTSDAVLTFGVTGLVNNPALGVVDTAGTVLSGTLTRAGGETVLGGPYAITQGSLVANSNYTLSSFAGNGLTITPAALNVAANSQNKIFGTSDPVLTFSVTGLVNNPALGIADTAGIVLSGALTRVPGESALGGPYAITQGSLAANSNYTLGFTLNNFTITGAAEEPVLGFNPGQIIYTGIINNDPYERPGNFWHISLNYNNADPGFDVMRGTGDLNSRSNRHSINCASVFGGGFCETWQFPQQFGEGDKKEAK